MGICSIISLDRIEVSVIGQVGGCCGDEEELPYSPLVPETMEICLVQSQHSLSHLEVFCSADMMAHSTVNTRTMLRQDATLMFCPGDS